MLNGANLLDEEGEEGSVENISNASQDFNKLNDDVEDVQRDESGVDCEEKDVCDDENTVKFWWTHCSDNGLTVMFTQLNAPLWRL